MAELKKQRITAIDVAKGIGILFVVAGHTMYSPGVNTAIYSFSVRMPLFFMVSGMFVKPEKYAKFWDFLKHKLQILICPYVLFCLLGIIVFAGRNILMGKSLSEVAIRAVKSLGIIVWAPSSHYFGTINTPLWFVPCLLLIEIMYYYLSRIKNKPLFMVTTVLIVALGWFMESKYCPVDLWWLPFNMCSAFFAYGFFVFGKISFDFLKKNILTVPLKGKSLAKLIVSFAVLLAISIFLASVNGYVSIGSRMLGNGLYLYILGISGAIAIFILARFLEKCPFLEFCGRNSFIVMASHVLISCIITAATEIIASRFNIPFINLGLNEHPQAIARFIIVSALSVLFTLLYNKIKKSILGKRKPITV